MPELPEVETIQRGLSQRILKKQIQNVHILSDKNFLGDPQLVLSRRVKAINRRGKMLLITLDPELFLMIHLRMTGQLIYQDCQDKFAAGHPDANFEAAMPSRHTRVYFDFSDNSQLFFNDQRKFGFIKVTDASGLAQDSFLRRLAKEPWDISAGEFYANLMRHPKQSIKASILDQGVIAGVGNIYADEGLFRAKIFPGRPTKLLSRSDSDTLLLALQSVMQESIASGGSTMKDYRRADGSKGHYLEKFAKVFRREGQACPCCQTTIIKTKIAGRGTHYCPSCQKF